MLNNLKRLREQAGLSLGELSKRTGIPESCINRAERGVTDLSGQRWKVLAEALDCSVDELFGTAPPVVRESV